MNAQARKAHLQQLLMLPDDLVEMLSPLGQSDLKLARLMEQELPGILTEPDSEPLSPPTATPALPNEPPNAPEK